MNEIFYFGAGFVSGLVFMKWMLLFFKHYDKKANGLTLRAKPEQG
jgi:hypothetical protein